MKRFSQAEEVLVSSHISILLGHENSFLGHGLRGTWLVLSPIVVYRELRISVDVNLPQMPPLIKPR